MFYVGQTSLDYLTLTSFNPQFYEYVQTQLDTLARKADRGKRRMQYMGTLYHHESGHAFLGSGKQKDDDHYLCQISGLMADHLWPVVSKFIRGGTARVTRLDLQRTIDYERLTWSQKDLADGLRDLHPEMSVSYVESVSGPQDSKLATVYWGSRHSDRFVRIYEKKGMADDVFLRFEVEYKSPRSHAVALHILEHGEYDSVFLDEVTRSQHAVLAVKFGKVGHTMTPKVVKPTPATVKWLKEQVAPALDRVLNDDNIDTEEVRDLLLRILTDGRQ